MYVYAMFMIIWHLIITVRACGWCMQDYKISIMKRKCFACNQREMLWANFPCQHLLWCDDCKLQAIWAAGASEHKCVVCDEKVQKIGLIRSHEFCQRAIHGVPNVEEFPPFNPNHVRRYGYTKL